MSTLDPVAKVDDFTNRLMQIFKTVPEQTVRETVNLGVLRSDYMFNGNEDGSESLLQIEINTIAASFACLSTKVGHLHRYLLARNAESVKMKEYISAASPSFSEDLLEASKQIPENSAIQSIGLAISVAHIIFGDTSACVLFIVQPNEKNVVDQRLLEQELFVKSGVHVEFMTLKEVAARAKLVDGNTLVPVSVVYYRAGYSPDDYTSEDEWTARALMEKSSAIKCPTVAYQLTGTKKVQQMLCVPGVLEKFLSEEKASTLRKCFAAQYSLGSMATEEAQQAVADAIQGKGVKWVLKPQREGGGNNFYGQELADFLIKNKDTDILSGYVLMQRIFPKDQTSVCLKKGLVSITPSISELGIYGVFLGDGSEEKPSILNQYAGYLLRTKPLGVDEGGVATGYSVLSSVFLR